MITGQNSEVLHDQLAFHVQTEDKGVSNPLLESLVYLGGQVVASKRTSYAEELEKGFSEDEIAALLDHQHRTMIAAVQRGRFDDKVRELRGALEEDAPLVAELAQPKTSGLDAFPKREEPPDDTMRVVLDASGLDVPPSLRSEGDTSAPPLDEVVLDYLVAREEGETLHLQREDAEEIQTGTEIEIILRATSSSGAPVDDVVVDAKLISTASPPLVLGLGQTNTAGLAFLRLLIPGAEKGPAAVIVTGTSALGTAELKYLL